jgi:hypothetical protein
MDALLLAAQSPVEKDWAGHLIPRNQVRWSVMGGRDG